MSANKIKEGKVVNVTLAANANSGDPLVYGDLFGILENTGSSGDTNGALDISEAERELPKTTTDVYAVGAILRWDASTKKFLASKTGKTGAAICTVAAGSGATTVRCIPLKLCQTFS